VAVVWQKLAYEGKVITKAFMSGKGDIIYASAAGVPARLAIGDDGQVLTVNTDVPAWEAGGGGGLPDAAAGDLLDAYADTERTTTSDTYVKVKEIMMARAGTYRIKFDLKINTGTYVANGKVYKNGGAVGTEQSNNTTTYVTKSEDIAGFSAGDLIQLYIKVGTYYEALARYFRIYCTQPIDNEVVTD